MEGDKGRVGWFTIPPFAPGLDPGEQALSQPLGIAEAGINPLSAAVNTFDRHLLREWLSILFLVVVAACGMISIQVAVDDLRDIREAGARGGDLVRYFLTTMPQFLALALPLVLLISLLFVLGKLHRANELTAMRAAGVGLPRLMASVWLVGLLCCGLSWWLNAQIVPWSVEQSRALKSSFEFKKEERQQQLPPDRIGAVYSIGFDNPIGHRMWFFNRYSRFTERAYGISVSELDLRRRETKRILASEAWRDPKHGGWIFKNGRVISFVKVGGGLTSDEVSDEAQSSVPFKQLYVGNYDEEPDLMLLIDRRPIDLSFTELGELVDYFAIDNNSKGIPYAVRFYGLIADTLGPLIVIGLAIPFAVSGVRVNPAVGVSKSIGLFLLYYVLENLASSLATKGLVDPLAAAWIPNLAMAGLGIWLFFRVR